MNKQEKENWAGTLSVVLSGFFQACQHDLEDQMLIIALATGDHGTPLRDAAQDAIAESTDTGAIVELRYSEEASDVLRGSCDDWRAEPVAHSDLHYFGAYSGEKKQPWHVVLKHEQDASVCSHDFFVRCSAPNDAWYQCVKCHQTPARQDEFRLSIAETLGHTHPGMEGPYVMSDRDILKAILELRANVSEDARQLQEARTVRNDLGEQLRQTTTAMRRLHGERDEARAECLRLRSVRAELDEARAKLAKQIAVAEALANVRQQIERFPAMTVEAKREAAREALQSTASTLRKLATTGGYCQELVNAAAEVESIFDWLYLPKPVDDVAAPLTRRSV